MPCAMTWHAGKKTPPVFLKRAAKQIQLSLDYGAYVMVRALAIPEMVIVMPWV